MNQSTPTIATEPADPTHDEPKATTKELAMRPRRRVAGIDIPGPKDVPDIRDLPREGEPLKPVVDIFAKKVRDEARKGVTPIVLIAIGLSLWALSESGAFRRL